MNPSATTPSRNDDRLDDASWPTTLRFSRRLGEAFPDAQYASAIEAPGRPEHRSGARAGLLLMVAFTTPFVLAWLF